MVLRLAWILGTLTTAVVTTTNAAAILSVKQKWQENSGHYNWIRGNTDRPKLGCQVQVPRKEDDSAQGPSQ